MNVGNVIGCRSGRHYHRDCRSCVKKVEEQNKVALLEIVGCQAMAMEDERSRVAAAAQTVAAAATQTEALAAGAAGAAERRRKRFASIKLPRARARVAPTRKPVVTFPVPVLDGNASFYKQDDFNLLPALLN